MNNISGLSLIGSLVLSMAQMEKTATPTDPAQTKAATDVNNAKTAKPVASQEEQNVMTIPVKKRGDHDILA